MIQQDVAPMDAITFHLRRSSSRNLPQSIRAAAVVALCLAASGGMLHMRSRHDAPQTLAPQTLAHHSGKHSGKHSDLARRVATTPAATTGAPSPFGSLLVSARSHARPEPRPLAQIAPAQTIAAAKPVPTQTIAAAAAAKPVPAPAPLAPQALASVEPAQTAAQEPPTEATRETAQADAPLPPRRPTDLTILAARQLPSPARVPAQQYARVAPPPAAPADNRSFLEKFFGGAEQTASTQAQTTVIPKSSSGQALAYANSEPGLFGGLRNALGEARGAVGTPQAASAAPAGGADRYTAIYDITARTVYMPDGTRLEAHSGLGDRLDNPRYVHERMHGPTPPHLYQLSMREALFHGVAALRLTPIGPGHVFGRAGLLAHTFMLGPNGDSNGCVSFRNYDAFLRAYQSGQVKRLMVVARLN